MEDHFSDEFKEGFTRAVIEVIGEERVEEYL